MKNKLVIGLATLLIVVLAVTGISCSSSPAEDTSAETYIIGDEDGDWGYPTPYTSYPRGPGYLRLSYLFDTLVWKDSEGFTEALAKDWSFAEDELSYTFSLREGVNWHDGESFSAADVVFTYEYYEKHPSHWAQIEKIKDIEKLDEHTVKIYLEEPYAPFLNNVAGVMPILPRHIWEEVDEPEEFTTAEAAIGTGPYELEKYRREEGLYRYEANPEYYLGEPLVEQLMFIKVSDPHLALQRGDVNYAMVEAEAKETLENAGYEVVQGEHDFNLKLMFNHTREPFDQLEFRQAVARAIDLENLVERALRGHGIPGSPGMISPDSYWFAGEDALPDYEQNMEKARRMIEEMGYSFRGEEFEDEDGEPLSLELLTAADYSREAEIVAGQLEELGLKIETRSAERNVVDNRIRDWNYDMAITAHGGLGGDPEIFWRFMLGKASPHLNTRYDYPPLKEALQSQAREMDLSKRKELAEEMQRIFAEEIPSYTLHYPTWYFAYDETVDWFFTRDGIGVGTPLPLNKMALVDEG